VEFDPNIWHIADQMSDEENPAEPVFDEFILTQLAEAAEAEDRLQRAKYELRQIRAEREDRERVQADARFAEARGQYPNLSVHQIAAMLDDEPQHYVNAIQS
jgi:hypothetical protein